MNDDWGIYTVVVVSHDHNSHTEIFNSWVKGVGNGMQSEWESLTDFLMDNLTA